MTPTSGVPEVLASSRTRIAPAMRRAVERLSPDIHRLASYHLGWTDRSGSPVGAPTGKGIRPTLALLSAEAVWADAEVGVPGGVAVELVHNFSLIHDDIIDGDHERHHRPTLWSAFGVGRAIIVGDALENLAHQVLLEASGTTGPAASTALAEATSAMIAGQADDIAFEHRRDVSVEECMAMSAAKTGALLGCASSIGAILAGAWTATGWPATMEGAVRSGHAAATAALGSSGRRSPTRRPATKRSTTNQPTTQQPPAERPPARQPTTEEVA